VGIGGSPVKFRFLEAKIALSAKSSVTRTELGGNKDSRVPEFSILVNGFLFLIVRRIRVTPQFLQRVGLRFLRLIIPKPHKTFVILRFRALPIL
jgi:hypothetical protein